MICRLRPECCGARRFHAHDRKTPHSMMHRTTTGVSQVNATNYESLQIDELEEITKSANVPTLLMVIYQVTGDERWLEPPYQPTRTRGLSDHDSGGLPDSIQAEVRHAAAQAFHHLREGRPPAIAAPTPEQMATMLGVCVGESVDHSYGLMFSQEFGRRIGAAESASPRPASVPGDYRVLIIGAGVSGIIAAQRMQEMGLSYLLVDKHDAPGGNWLDNRYPGVGVDTPSHLYSYSFAPHDWGYHFELRESLEDYFGKAFELVGARPNTRFRTAVVRAEYDEGAARWLVTLRAADGTLEVLPFNAILTAVGILNQPKLPRVAGIGGFNGPSFHTSEWPPGLDVGGKPV